MYRAYPFFTDYVRKKSSVLCSEVVGQKWGIGVICYSPFSDRLQTE